MLTKWTDRRLERLYARHNAKYWSGALPDDIAITNEVSEEGNLGTFYRTEAAIVIDVSRHTSDRGVRDTVLHEMCHVATPDSAANGGHDSAFFEQLERLLTLGASVSVGFAEAGGLRHLHQIPERFALCRAKFKREADRWQRQIARDFAGERAADLSPEMIEDDLVNAAIEGLTWKQAAAVVGREYALVDLDGAILPEYVTWFEAARERFDEAREGALTLPLCAGRQTALDIVLVEDRPMARRFGIVGRELEGDRVVSLAVAAEPSDTRALPMAPREAAAWLEDFDEDTAPVDTMLHYLTRRVAAPWGWISHGSGGASA